jgi:hypothetical protein
VAAAVKERIGCEQRVKRGFTVCAAELGHGEHEAVVHLARPPETRPGLAVPVLLLTTQR